MAKKYIDTDVLKAEIERRLKYTHDWLRGDEKRHPKQTAVSTNYYKMKGDERTLDALLNFIDSLQQEQPCEDLKAEEEIEKYMDIRGLIWYDDINLSDFARHFYELGRQSKESISKDLEEEYKDKDWGILQDVSIGEEDEEE